MATRRAYVYMSGRDLRVFPPVTVLNQNDDMEIVNLSGGTVDWDVPPGPFGSNGHRENVPNNGKSRPQRAAQGPQVVSYKVTGPNGQSAQGNSDPVIIIDT